MSSVLIVDDEQSMREFLSICLGRSGYTVSVSDSGKKALTTLANQPIDIVVTDLRMPGDIDGLGLLHEIKKKGYDCEVIVVTAYASPATAISAMKQGAYDYLTKPFKIDEINAVIERALEKRALVTANQALRAQVSGRYRLASLLAKSPSMQKVFSLIEKIKSTTTNVLVTGESGTGKELAARALHTEGNRGNQQFVAVNCGAIPENLMESELFGHKKGSFTGAVADKEGLFQTANGGTLFLDEIGELSLGLQVKLLRALQERTVKPVGATEEIPVDVRVVAATNRDLEADVSSGAFRGDLYYRLNVIEIRLPPLRQRREDIPLLIEHFIARFSGILGTRITGIHPDAMKALQDYDYPGNVRELENIVERGVTLTGEGLIVRDVLPKLTSRERGPNFSASFPEDGVDLDRELSDYERNLVSKALEISNGVRKTAANLLGINQRSLRYRLAKLGLAEESDT